MRRLSRPVVGGLGTTVIMLALVAFLLSSLYLRQESVHAAGVSTPTISYTPVGPRSLIFVNNPEAIMDANSTSVVGGNNPSDLADNRSDGLGRRSIYTETLAVGSYRDVFDHANDTGRSIGYGLRVHNAGSTPATVTLEGSGFATNALNGAWGKVFAQMFNAEANTATVLQQISVPAGATRWLWREDAQVDSTGGTPQAIGNVFLAGAIDFKITGAPLVLSQLAYSTTADAVPEDTIYSGYLKRVEQAPGSHCNPQPPQPAGQRCNDVARTYKGIANGVSEVQEDRVNFVIDEQGVTPGPLKIQYHKYVKQPADGKYVPEAALTTDTSWITHQVPGQAAGQQPPLYPVSNDMLGFKMPASDNVTIDPFTQSDARNSYPNLANWGVVYTLNIGLLNKGRTPYTFNFRVSVPSGYPTHYIAYQADNKQWTAKPIYSNDSTIIRSVKVPAATDSSYGNVFFSVKLVLGLPSAGLLVQSAELAQG